MEASSKLAIAQTVFECCSRRTGKLISYGRWCNCDCVAYAACGPLSILVSSGK